MAYTSLICHKLIKVYARYMAYIASTMTRGTAAVIKKDASFDAHVPSYVYKATCL